MLKAEALTKLATSAENEYRKFLLCEFVDAYMPLEGPQLEEFEHMLHTKKDAFGLRVGKTQFEKALEEALRRLVQGQLDKRFGPLSPAIMNRLGTLSADELERIGLAWFDAKSLDELGLGDDQTA